MAWTHVRVTCTHYRVSRDGPLSGRCVKRGAAMGESSDKVLTVSVAAYNVAEYLRETLASCKVRNSDKIEVIIVNDGSKDDTLRIAREFEREDPDLFRVIDKPNGGYGSTMNASLGVARGKYFRHLDGDDWFDKRGLEEFVDLLAECEADATITPYTFCYEDGSPSQTVDDMAGFAEGIHTQAELGHVQGIAAHSLAYRTELLRTIGFRMTEGCFYTDCEYAYLPFSHVRSVYVGKSPVYCYRMGREGQSMSAAGIEAHHEDIVRVRVRLVRELAGISLEDSPYLHNHLQEECLAPYYFLLRIAPSRERKEALVGYDRFLRQYPDLYRMAGKKSPKVRLLRASAFLAYRFLCAAPSGDAR